MLTGCQKARNIDRNTDRQKGRKTDRRQKDFSASYQNIVQNVNRMSER